MYYEINVALKGWHFFATDERSLTNKKDAEEALKIFLKKFPKSEGYSVSMTYYEQRGTILFDGEIKKVQPNS